MLKIPELDTIILSQLSDENINNYMYVNKACFEFCKDESFWEKRTLEKYPKFKEVVKSGIRTWKVTYFLLGYYTRNFNPNVAITKLSMAGTDFLDLIKYFLLFGVKNLKPAITIAKQNKRQDLVDFLIQYGENLNKKSK